MFLDSEPSSKTVLIHSCIMYVGYTNIFSTPKGILISDIHCIRHAGYKNIVCSSQRCSYNRHPLYYR